MADPVTMSVVMAGATVAKTFVDVQARNAQIKDLKQQGRVRSELANQEFLADTRDANRVAASQRARFAAQGTTFSGSPLLVQEQQASDSDFELRMRRFGALNEGVSLMNQANQARAERSGALIGAGTSLLGT